MSNIYTIYIRELLMTFLFVFFFWTVTTNLIQEHSLFVGSLTFILLSIFLELNFKVIFLLLFLPLFLVIGKPASMLVPIVTMVFTGSLMAKSPSSYYDKALNLMIVIASTLLTLFSLDLFSTAVQYYIITAFLIIFSLLAIKERLCAKLLTVVSLIILFSYKLVLLSDMIVLSCIIFTDYFWPDEKEVNKKSNSSLIGLVFIASMVAYLYKITHMGYLLYCIPVVVYIFKSIISRKHKEIQSVFYLIYLAIICFRYEAGII